MQRPVIGQEFMVLCNSVLDKCFDIIDSPNAFQIKIKNMMREQIESNAAKYASLGLHYIVTDLEIDYTSIMEQFITPYARNEFIKLVAVTNYMQEYTSIPVKDFLKESHTQNGGTFSMSENQPVDATEKITTPYIKVNGKNNYKFDKTIEHNTVDEYKNRQEMLNGNVQTIFQFVDDWMEKLIYEYNIAY